MKIIAQTERGKFYIHEKESVENRIALIADWQFFRGIIQPEEELNFDDLKKVFCGLKEKDSLKKTHLLLVR